MGFTTGAGVYIGLSQVKYMFGVKVHEEEYYYGTYRYTPQKTPIHHFGGLLLSRGCGFRGIRLIGLLF